MASSVSSRRHVAHTVGATLLAGALTYVFLGTISRSLDAGQYDLFSVYWSLSLILGFGLFLPVEQELSRAGAAAADPGTAGRIGVRIAAEVAAGILVLLLLSSPLLLAAGLPVELVLVAGGFVAISAVQFSARGYLLAARRFSAYANVLAADAVLRVVLAGALALAGVLVLGGRLTAGSFAVVLMIAILLAHAPTLRRPAGSPRGTRDETRLMRRAVLGLLAGTAAAQVLLNVGPILLNAAAVEPGTAGAFQSTFSLARIPLFLLVPLQGAVVAPLAGLVAEGRTARMTALMLRLALGIAAVGLVGAGAAYLIGPWAVELVFGAGRSLPAPDVALLVLGVCVHAGLVLTAGALIAAERHVRASVAWVAAVVLFALASALLWAPLGPVGAVAVAFLVSSLLGWLLALTELVAVGRRAAAGTAEAHRAE